MRRTYFVEFIDVSKADLSLGTSAKPRNSERPMILIMRIIYLLEMQSLKPSGKAERPLLMQEGLRLPFALSFCIFKQFSVYNHNVCRDGNIKRLIS